MLPTLSPAARLRVALTAFVARHVVQWDPAPAPSRLDVLDGVR